MLNANHLVYRDKELNGLPPPKWRDKEINLQVPGCLMDSKFYLSHWQANQRIHVAIKHCLGLVPNGFHWEIEKFAGIHAILPR